jgi:hypothetical protein
MKQFWIYERGVRSGVWLAEDQDDALLKYVNNQGFRDLQDKAARQLGDLALEKHNGDPSRRGSHLTHNHAPGPPMTLANM